MCADADGGCAAGISFWLVCFPADTIKTVMQNHGASLLQQEEKKANKNIVTPRNNINLFSAIKNIYLSDSGYGHGSIRNFYCGLLPCLVRSIPANGVVFMGVDFALQMLGDEDGFL